MVVGEGIAREGSGDTVMLGSPPTFVPSQGTSGGGSRTINCSTTLVKCNAMSVNNKTTAL